MNARRRTEQVGRDDAAFEAANGADNDCAVRIESAQAFAYRSNKWLRMDLASSWTWAVNCRAEDSVPE